MDKAFLKKREREEEEKDSPSKNTRNRSKGKNAEAKPEKKIKEKADKVTKEENGSDNVSDSDSEKYDFTSYQKSNPGKKLLPMPKKSKFRMRAHCNPLADISINYPLSPADVDWSLHFPVKFNKPQSSVEDLFINTVKHEIKYDMTPKDPVSTHEIPKELIHKVNILDFGCGYGGLLFEISQKMGKDDLALGMEIRDKVTNFVGEKIKTLIINTNYEKYINIGVIRTNCMKLMLNYFYKGQIDKIFFCFADPHFKKYTHRRRIINKYLMNDYAYMMRLKGRIYSITDVEDLHNWNVAVLSSSPSFRRMTEDEIKDDIFIESMKNTDEAKKVKKINGAMYIAVFERVEPKISNIEDLVKIVKVKVAEEFNGPKEEEDDQD